MSQKDHNKANSGTGDKPIQKDVRSWQMLWKALGSSVEVPKSIDISPSLLSPTGRLEGMVAWISPPSSSREVEEVRLRHGVAVGERDSCWEYCETAVAWGNDGGGV
jgi:hypothetical protein